MLLSGCPSADPEAKLDNFLEETEEEREEAANQKMDQGGTLADISGTHLFALSSTLSPATPLQFIATVETAADGTLSFNFQPLSLNVGSTTEPRMFVGETITIPGIAVDESGGFALDFGAVGVVGAANPITGADIEATLAIQAAIQSEDLWCGSVTGQVTVPLDYDLVNSTFAAVRVAATDPASLPMDVLAACPEGGEDTAGDTAPESDTDGEPPATSG